MNAVRAVLLFLLGVVFVFLGFPVAFFISAGLGYIFCLVGIGIGVYMVMKREKKALPLVLGVLLVVAGVVSLFVTAIIHASVYTVSKALEATTEALKTRNLAAKLNEPVKAGDWEIVVRNVREAFYIRMDGGYYGAREGQKIVLVRIAVKNIGKEMQRPVLFIVLVSTANKSYERIYPLHLNYIWEVSESLKSNAIPYRELDTAVSLAPGTLIEGDVLFQIPKEENPDKIVIKVGLVGGYEITVRLRG
jgi:hypothetical protein